MGLSEELERIASAAARHAGPGEQVTGVLAAEPAGGRRVYLVAFEAGGGHAWLALDQDGAPVESRALVREAASIVVTSELAAETAGGGQLEELRQQLRSLRVTEAPPGIDEAEEAAHALEAAVGAPPRLATPAYLDEVGAATLRLERALGELGPSPFTAAMRAAVATVDEFLLDVERGYKRELR